MSAENLDKRFAEAERLRVEAARTQDEAQVEQLQREALANELLGEARALAELAIVSVAPDIRVHHATYGHVRRWWQRTYNSPYVRTDHGVIAEGWVLERDDTVYASGADAYRGGTSHNKSTGTLLTAEGGIHIFDGKNPDDLHAVDIDGTIGPALSVIRLASRSMPGSLEAIDPLLTNFALNHPELDQR